MEANTDDPMQSAEIMTGIRARIRLTLALRALNMNERERLTVGLMIVDRRPWPVQTLSEMIGYSRAIISSGLLDLSGIGFATSDKGGWSLTGDGLRFFEMMQSNLIAIASGKSDQFSPVFAAEVEDLVDATMRRPFHSVRDWRCPIRAVGPSSPFSGTL